MWRKQALKYVQQWRRERAKGSPRSLKPLGKKDPLKRSPGNLAVGAQKPAGPEVPAQRAVLPPHVKHPPTAIFREENPQERKYRPKGRYFRSTQKNLPTANGKTRKGGSTGKRTGTSGGTVVPELLPVQKTGRPQTSST